MKKPLIAIGIVAVLVVGILLLGNSGGSSGYLVRAIFDNGGFLVEGEEVRIGGATVGSIESVDVTQPGEVTSYENGKPQSAPGKAVVVLRIDDGGFQDFRQDANCHIRPQSLIGEKFVDCRPTVPRAPGSEPAPALREIPDGEPGAGQHLLQLGQNSTSVDPDLINNINELPYAQRFRLIFNEFGAALAGRGEDLQELVIRANPVLRDTNKLFGELASQSKQLAKLTADSDEILRPFARERESVAGFFNNSGAAAEASAEKGEALEESFSKLPRFLRELRKTMGSLEGFSDAATPVFAEFGRNAEQLTAATEALTPFSAASTVSLKALGATGEVIGPMVREADPVVLKARELARSGAEPTTNLAKFLGATDKRGGWDSLVDLIYNSAGATNEFDQYGHFGRSLVALVDCTEYWVGTVGRNGCVARFNGPNSPSGEEEGEASSASALLETYLRIQKELAEESGGTSADLGSAPPLQMAPAPAEPLTKPAPATPDESEAEEAAPAATEEAPASASRSSRRALLDYLLGP